MASGWDRFTQRTAAHSLRVKPPMAADLRARQLPGVRQGGDLALTASEEVGYLLAAPEPFKTPSPRRFSSGRKRLPDGPKLHHHFPEERSNRGKARIDRGAHDWPQSPALLPP